MGTISLPMVQSSIDMYDIEYWLKIDNWFIKFDDETISKVKELSQDTKMIHELEISTVQSAGYSRKDIQNRYTLIYEKLLHAGVTVIKIKIPTLQELVNEKQKHEPIRPYPSNKCFYSKEAYSVMKPILPKIINSFYDELKEQYFRQEKQEHEHCEKRIFFVGPCIVAGGCEFGKNIIRNMCSTELQKKDIQVEIISISVFRDKLDDIYELEAYDLTNYDIVIMIEEPDIIPEQAGKYDIDITHVFNSYDGDKYLYYDALIHTTVYGNKLITDKIIEKILPLLNKMEDTNKKILIHKSECDMRAQNQEQSMLNEFLDNCKSEISKYEKCIKSNTTNIGAIVMNTNPFTKGHRYLVETAAKQVDLLIVFVVEEDASYIPFNSRLELVKEGIKDLHNIVVVPSGHFIISKSTFKNYFEKEILQNSTIDASTDIRIFGEKIAKELRITKRFVGEEPIDQVTRQYNEQMKRLLPDYGVELIEIPRITSGKNVISASYVRKLLKAASFEKLKCYVPAPTYEYLMRSKSFLEKREVCEKLINERLELKDFSKIEIEPINNIPELLKVIHENDKVAFYGIGIDAIMLLKEVPENDMAHIKFFDKRSGGVLFDKEFTEPKELLSKYNEYKIIITSRQYGAEMYSFLRKLGVSLERICLVL